MCISLRKLDLVIPCFNEQESLPLFFEALKDVKDKMNDVSVRFIFVNDGSRDNTLGLLRDYAEKYDYVKYISHIFNLFPDLNKQTILQLIHDTDMNETIFSLSLSSKIRKNLKTVFA